MCYCPDTNSILKERGIDKETDMLNRKRKKMAAKFIAKRGAINTYRASSFNNSTRCLVDGVISRHFASNGNDGSEKSKEEGMGTTTDGKAPNVTMSHAADKSKEGLKQALEETGDASKPKKGEKDEGSEENVAVGDDGTVKGQNQSSG